MREISEEFSDPRDRNFYFYAARILGFIDQGERLTPSGRQLATLERTDAFRGLAEGFAQSPIGSAWLRWAAVEDVRSLEPSDARAFLAKHTALSATTLIRRASLLEAWVDALIDSLPPSRSVHAKIYVADEALSLGSSNLTGPGLGEQSEANVRFLAAEGRRAGEARALAEGLWAQAVDSSDGFIKLLDALLRGVTWQEALGRAAALILEGAWAKRYVPTALIDQLDSRYGVTSCRGSPRQCGSSRTWEACWVGRDRLREDSDGRLAHPRRLRSAVPPRVVHRPAPLILSPPQVAMNWETALRETGLSFQVESHGPLSSSRASRHAGLIQHIADTELLAIDEAHNFVNKSDRTLRLTRSITFIGPSTTEILPR